jgi:hypothetical protein
MSPEYPRALLDEVKLSEATCSGVARFDTFIAYVPAAIVPVPIEALSTFDGVMEESEQVKDALYDW